MDVVYRYGNAAIYRVVVGPLDTNCYIIYDSDAGECMVVDPGGSPDKIIGFVREISCSVKYVVATHAHFDHVLGVPRTVKETGSLFGMHRSDLLILGQAEEYCRLYDSSWEIPRIDFYFSGDEEITVGNIVLKVIHTPGHTPGSISIMGKGFVLTGDTLFKGTIGSTKFLGGDPRALERSIRKLLELPSETIVLPGHGDKTTIGYEKKYNKYVKAILGNINK